MFPVSQIVRLKSRDVISCRNYGIKPKYGQRNYVPIVFFHGNMNSSKFMPLFSKTEEFCKKMNCQLIIFNRPGIGGSIRSTTDMTYSDIAKMIVEGIDKVVGKGRKVALIGYSSGGPHALAAASLLGERAVSVSLISSEAHYVFYGHHPHLNLNKVSNEELMKSVKVNVSNLSESLMRIGNVEKKALCMADLEEAIQQGYDGLLLDYKLESSEWSFKLEELNKETKVFIWYGEKDEFIPTKYQNLFVEELKSLKLDIKTKVIADESHSMIRRKFKEILTEAVEVYKTKVKMWSTL